MYVVRLCFVYLIHVKFCQLFDPMHTLVAVTDQYNSHPLPTVSFEAVNFPSRPSKLSTNGIEKIGIHRQNFIFPTFRAFLQHLKVSKHVIKINFTAGRYRECFHDEFSIAHGVCK